MFINTQTVTISRCAIVPILESQLFSTYLAQIQVREDCPIIVEQSYMRWHVNGCCASKQFLWSRSSALLFLIKTLRFEFFESPQRLALTFWCQHTMFVCLIFVREQFWIHLEHWLGHTSGMIFEYFCWHIQVKFQRKKTLSKNNSDRRSE